MVFVNFLKQVLHHLNSCVGKNCNTLTNASQAWVKYVKKKEGPTSAAEDKTKLFRFSRW